ncbi:MAG: hypothetical protein V3V10_05205 [Planctomycetota bacterium]
MRQENLTTVKGGLNRLRTKGAALKDSLFELLNGYVTVEKTVKVRPGTILDTTLPSGTFGLISFEGLLQVFASSVIGGIPAGYNLNVLRAPTGNALSKVHFAEPFLGLLYVSAEFNTDEIYHFWLRTGDTWAANTLHKANDLVIPTTPNGFVYRANRIGDANPIWTPDVPRTVGEKVEPTTANNFYFEVTATFGTTPLSGLVEPAWDDARASELFIDTQDGTPTQEPPTPPPDTPDDRVPFTIEDKYKRPLVE